VELIDMSIATVRIGPMPHARFARSTPLIGNT